MKISYSKGLTLNLGDYNSARFDIDIEDEVQDNETQEETYNRLRQYVDEKINHEFKKLIKLKGKI